MIYEIRTLSPELLLSHQIKSNMCRPKNRYLPSRILKKEVTRSSHLKLKFRLEISRGYLFPLAVPVAICKNEHVLR